MSELSGAYCTKSEVFLEIIVAHWLPILISRSSRDTEGGYSINKDILILNIK